MKSLVLYSSQSGNTQKLADTVYGVLTGVKEICAIDDAPESLSDFDFVAVGFWFQGGKPDPKTTAYLPRLGKKNIFLFATHGAAKSSAHAQKGMEQAIELATDATVLGAYSCQGEVNPKVLQTAAAKLEPPSWLSDAPSAKGHPDENDLTELRQKITEIVIPKE